MKLSRRTKMSLAIALLIILSPILVMAIYVDDWSRDLTTNVAWTDPANADLKPIDLAISLQELEDTITQFTDARTNWSQPQPPEILPEDSPLHQITNSPPGETQFHLVRTTGVVRYADDVWIVAEPLNAEPLNEEEKPTRWRLHAHSQSRVGKGDLGQNPRNLRELLTALRQATN